MVHSIFSQTTSKIQNELIFLPFFGAGLTSSDDDMNAGNLELPPNCTAHLAWDIWKKVVQIGDYYFSVGELKFLASLVNTTVGVSGISNTGFRFMMSNFHIYFFVAVTFFTSLYEMIIVVFWSQNFRT